MGRYIKDVSRELSDDHNSNRTRSSRLSPKPVMEAMIEGCEEKDTSCGGCRGGERERKRRREIER